MHEYLQSDSQAFCTQTIGAVAAFNPCPAEPGYTLLLQTV